MSDTDDELKHLAPLPWDTTPYCVWDAKKRVVLSLSLRIADKQAEPNKRLLEMVARAVNSYNDLIEDLHNMAVLLSALVDELRLIDEFAAAMAEIALLQARTALAKARCDNQ